MYLFFYTRIGCCLCKGLEQRLEKVPFDQLLPQVQLKIIDIDSEELNKKERGYYDLRVPILAIHSPKLNKSIELPRVSPRLDSNGIFNWLQNVLNKYESNDEI